MPFTFRRAEFKPELRMCNNVENQAYIVAGNQETWDHYLRKRKDEHTRKYLRGLLSTRIDLGREGLTEEKIKVIKNNTH